MKKFFLILVLFVVAVVSLSAQTATIYVLRKFHYVGCGIVVPISVNGYPVTNIGVRQYIECIVPEGTVTVSSTSGVASINVRAGEKYYLFAEFGSLQDGIVLANAAEGEQSKSKFRMIGSFDVSSNSSNVSAISQVAPLSRTPAARTVASSGDIQAKYDDCKNRYGKLKDNIRSIMSRQGEFMLSETDKVELNTINELLSDVNRELYEFTTHDDIRKKQKSMDNVSVVLTKLDNIISVKYGNYIQDTTPSNLAVNTGYASQPQSVPMSSNNKQVEQQAVAKSDVDINIPVTDTKAENTFVLIIANENYEFVDNVQYALNDGAIFREYCIKTLGVPERQVWFYKDASAGIISGGVDKMVQAMEIFDKANAIVYYCGHGIPDEKTGDAYIVPTDGKGTNVATCYSLNKLYKTLSGSKSTSVTYFMDACFTGANRDGSMLVAARGVAREPKKETISGNTVVFSAASADETAMPFNDKQHGLFTYFLLKKLQETQGKVSYGELADYIRDNVRKEAFLTNEKPQNPMVATSEESADSWRNLQMIY